MDLCRSAVIAVLLFLASTVSAATFTVTSSADSGPGTLRQAILDANASPGLDLIRFTTDVLIGPSSLPQITDVVDIDGLRGATRTTVTGVLGFTAFNFSAGSSGSTLRNMSVRTFSTAVRIATGVTGVTIADNFIQYGVEIYGDQNTLQNNFPVQLVQTFGDRNVVLDNHIGTLHIQFAADNRIGSATSGNTIGLVTLQSAGGTIVEGNILSDVQISNALPPAGGSTIIGNTLNGTVQVFNVTGVEITQNTSTDPFPIDLNGDGPTPNDPAPDADSGANNLQNFPVITSAVVMNNDLQVSGSLVSGPSTQYRIEVFANGAFFGSLNVTTDASGNAAFTQNVPGGPLPPAGATITATATNTTTLDTSEVSAAANVVVIAATTPITTLSEWALIALAGALIAIVLLRLR